MIEGNTSKQRHSPCYPPPFIDDPLLGCHVQSVIVLHSRGLNGQKLGTSLLQKTLPEGSTLQQSLPHANFIFPKALF